MTAGRPFAEVIGPSGSQSRLPAIMAFWIGESGIAADYRSIGLDRGQFQDHLHKSRKESDWRGCNLLSPFKLDALLLADERTDLAVAAGAANLLALRDGALVAANTDVHALRVALARVAAAPGQAITLLGTGIAAKAALVALRLAGLGPVQIQARDLAEARSLSVEFGLGGPPRPFDTPISDAGLINATPVGSAGGPPSPFELSALPGNGWVIDLATDPGEGSLAAAYGERGLAAVDGLSLLIEQAAASFELLFGSRPRRRNDAQLMERLK